MGVAKGGPGVLRPPYNPPKNIQKKRALRRAGNMASFKKAEVQKIPQRH